jgi:hypothetical protein
MSRFSLVATCLIAFVLCAACTKTNPQPKSTQTTPKPSEIRPLGQESTASPELSANPDIARAQKMLADKDIKGGIRALENLAKTQRPPSNELKTSLIDAHVQYISQLSTMHNVRPNQLEVLTEVLYSHSTRVLDLDPTNAMAKATRESTLTYYTHQKKAPPLVIDPLVFYDELLNQKAASEAPQSGSEPAGGN